jgi:hypothetical protein
MCDSLTVCLLEKQGKVRYHMSYRTYGMYEEYVRNYVLRNVQVRGNFGGNF